MTLYVALLVLALGCGLPEGTFMVRYRTFADEMDMSELESLEHENARLTELLGALSHEEQQAFHAPVCPRLRK